MYFDMAGVDHQPLKVRVLHQGLQYPFPDPLVTPPAEPAVYIPPVSVCFRQVPLQFLLTEALLPGTAGWAHCPHRIEQCRNSPANRPGAS